MSREEELLRRLRAAFQIEARESLEAMAAGLLELESGGENASGAAAIVERVYREAHNLKGAARAVNLAIIEAICQPLESVFATWKKGATPDRSSFDVLHSAIDTMLRVLDIPEDAAPPEISALTRQLADLASHPPAAAAPPRPKLVPAPPPVVAAPEIAEAIAPVPPPAPVPTPAPAVPKPATAPELPTPEPAPTPELAHAHEPAAKAEPTVSASTETVRIATSKLDTLLLQAEELLVAKQAARERLTALRDIEDKLAAWEKQWLKLQPVLRDLAQILPSDYATRNGRNGAVAILDFMEWNRAHIKQMQNTAHALSTRAASEGRALGGMIDNLLDDTKKLLMLPCATLLDQLPRVVRDVARERGKQAEFSVSGGDVELDKRILEEMKAPLIHLLRNAVDHGIESADIRRALGKPERAHIDLSVNQRGGEVEFALRDDGGGVNVAKVKERAVRLGLISADDALRLADNDAALLIFASELSTRDSVDEVSGRGLGMAIVREKVEHLGGRVRLETMSGRGTTFYLTLPLTLATFRGLLVEAAGHDFVLPTSDVARVGRLHRSEVLTIEGRPAVRLENRTMALVSLAEVLGLRELPGAKPSERLTVVVLSIADRIAAFTVDTVVDEQEVLVKRLGWPLLRVRHIAGATVLSSGQPSLILNAGDLLKSVAQGALRTAFATPNITAMPLSEAIRAPQGTKSILVADDSITSRMLLKDILEAAGYNVTTAVDGMEALTALRGGQFDLLVSDVDMPRLTGFDLVTRVRAEPGLTQLPAILVTGRDSREDRERGFDAGASAYVVKSNFDQSNLLEIVRRLI